MKVVAYTRYSSDNQREESIEAQVRAIMAYCKIKDYELIDIYTDMAMTATNDSRPEFQRMIADSKKGTFEGVVVHKLDRFARNRYDSAIYGRKLQVNGVKVISVLENLDDSPESVILRSVIEGYNEYYSLNLARETMKGLKENAYRAKHNGGIPPYGYDVSPDKTYSINEPEAEAVRLAFRLYLDGQGYGEIASTLNKLGYRTKTGKDFAKGGLYDILGNEKYTGVYIYNRRASTTKSGVKQNRKHKDPADIIRVEDGMPAIISKNDYERIRVQRENNRHKPGVYSALEQYALSGLLRCGKCGGAMTGARKYAGRGKTLYVTYECANRKRKKTCDAKPINRDYIEDLVYGVLKQDILEAVGSPNLISRIQDKLDTGRAEALRHLYTFEKRLEDNERQSKNIIDSIVAGMDPKFFVNKSNQLMIDNGEIKRSIGLLQYQIIENRIRIEDITKTLQSIDLDGDRTKLFKTMFDSVILTDSEIEVNYRTGF